MLIHLIFETFLAAITIVNYRVGKKNVLYPPFLFSLLWVVIFCLYILPTVQVDDLSLETMAMVVSGVAAFSAGGAVVRRVGYPRWVRMPMPSETLYRKILLLFCVALLPFFFLEIRRLGVEGGLDSLLVSARAAMVEALAGGDKAYSSPVYTVCPMIAIFTSFIYLIEPNQSRGDKIWLWSSILVAFAFCILTTGRTLVLQLFVGLLGIRALKSGHTTGREAWRVARYPLLCFALVLAILVPLDKDLSNFDGGATDIVMNFVIEYSVEPLAGLNYVLAHPSEFKNEPNHTFRQVLPTLASICGINYKPAPDSNDFVMVPLPTNVFTVFKWYYSDFGLWGMLAALFLIGVGQTWLFRKALMRADFYMFLFAISLYPLAMSGFDDQYSLLSYYMVAVSLGFAYFYGLRAMAAWVREVLLHTPRVSGVRP